MWRERIVVDPNIMAGKPVIRGTRIPVDAILRRLAEGAGIKDILEDYPNFKGGGHKSGFNICC